MEMSVCTGESEDGTMSVPRSDCGCNSECKWRVSVEEECAQRRGCAQELVWTGK